MSQCPCGCPEPVLPGNVYATKQCGNRHVSLLQKAGEDTRLPLCAYCGVVPVKRARRKYCDRMCAGSAAAESRSAEQRQAAAARLNDQNQEKYRAKLRGVVESICRELNTGNVFDLEMAIEIATRVWRAGYRSGYSTAWARKHRAAEKAA